MLTGTQRNLKLFSPLAPCFACRTLLHRTNQFFAWCSAISQKHRQTVGQASFATRVTPFKSHQQVWLSWGVSFWQGQAMIRPGSDKNVAFEYFWILSGEDGYSVHWKLVLALQSCGNKCFLRQQSRCGTVHLTALNEVLLPEKAPVEYFFVSHSCSYMHRNYQGYRLSKVIHSREHAKVSGFIKSAIILVLF